MSSPQANESDPLLSGDGDGRSDAQADKGARNSRLRELGLFAWALIATAAVIVLAIWTQHEQQTKHDHSTPASKRNLVFMVSDGMGPAPLSLTRSFRQHVEELPYGDTLTLDKHFWGTSRTRSSSSLVTDSAAGATAFSCGKKTYNGAISTLPNHDPCGTVLEAAKRAGYHTGLVVTTKIEVCMIRGKLSHYETNQYCPGCDSSLLQLPRGPPRDGRRDCSPTDRRRCPGPNC